MNALAAAEFHALGTTARVVVRGVDAHVARALLAEELDAIDRACSRFRDDSELARVNEAAGGRVPVGPVLIEAIEVALRAARLTDGLVDPTVGTAVRILGYDRDFEEIERFGPLRRVRVQRVAGWRCVELDPERMTVRVPAGVELDLGATAKALAADHAAARLSSALDTGVLVALGGDVAVAGDAPNEGWPVRVVDDHTRPEAPPGETVSIREGGLATSSTTVRQWRSGTESRHHLVDPETGHSTTGPFRTVTAAAASCVDANIATTAAMVLGADAPDWLRTHGFPSRLVADDGTVRHVGGWPVAGEAG